MQFFKMSNAGNSFILVFNQRIESEQVKKIFACSGVIADGVISLWQSDGKQGYRIFNKDSSEAGFCGNAAICAARFLRERGLVSKSRFSLHTQTGERRVQCVKRGQSESYLIRLGRASFEVSEGWLPSGSVINKLVKLDVDGKTVRARVTAVWLGNLHLVVTGAMGGDHLQIKKQLEARFDLPLGANVHFCKLVSANPYKIKAVPYERGCGRTLSCASGAAAIFSAYRRAGLVGKDASVIFEGGVIPVSATQRHVVIEGAGRFEEEGVLELCK